MRNILVNDLLRANYECGTDHVDWPRGRGLRPVYQLYPIFILDRMTIDPMRHNLNVE